VEFGGSLRIGHRLILHTVMVALLGVVSASICIGTLTYFMGRDALEKDAEKELVAIREIKKTEIERYFNETRNQLLAFATDRMIIDAMSDFTKGFEDYAIEIGKAKIGQYKTDVITQFLQSFSDEYYKQNGFRTNIDAGKLLNVLHDSAFALQYNFVIQNPNPLGNKDELIDTQDGSTFNEYHKKYHPSILNFLKKFGYYDIFLVDSKTGDVVYTTYKELDFTTNLKDGIVSQTDLGKVFREANDSTVREFVAISDYQPYLLSYDDEASFIATSIYKDGKKIGVLIFQLPIDVINSIMTNNNQWKAEGMGDTGETYLVGPDYLLRTMSRFFVESPQEYLDLMKKSGLPESTLIAMDIKKTTIGLQPVHSQGVKNVFEKNETGFGIFEDYRNVPVLMSYAPVNILGLHWAILSKIDKTEAFQPITDLFKSISISTPIVALIIIGISILVGIALSKAISTPIEKFSAVIKVLADEQDLTKRILVKSQDEIGEMAEALNHLLESFQEAFQETLNSSKMMQAKAQELREISDTMAEAGEDLEGSEKLAKTGEDLEDLSARIETLTSQFKVLEEEAEKTEDW